MKKLLPLALLASVMLAGCAADKSADTQTMTPNGGTPRDAKSTATNSNIPDNVKSQIPPK